MQSRFLRSQQDLKAKMEAQANDEDEDDGECLLCVELCCCAAWNKRRWRGIRLRTCVREVVVVETVLGCLKGVFELDREKSILVRWHDRSCFVILFHL